MLTVIKGVILGFTMSFLIGPALFSLLQTSIYTGKRAGVFLALGISLSDTTIIYLAFLGILQLLNTNSNFLIIGVIGGVILISFGIYTYLKKVIIDEEKKLIRSPMASPFTYIGKGFLLNFMNPFAWFFWITAMVTVSASVGDKLDVLYFFGGTIITVFSTDLLKVFIADKIKEHLNDKLLVRINRIVGIVLMLFGIVLILRTFYKLV
ncbi:MAG: LysE family transporter [Lentimicrobiaceae bacterium]|nr:LysE family transporter [Lentimicrobiaceae bacterium]